MRAWAAVMFLALAACSERAAETPAADDWAACGEARDPVAQEAACSKYLTANPTDDAVRRALALSNRAEAKRAQGDVTRALQDYAAALELDPENPVALQQRATILLDSGQVDAAHALLERLVAKQDSPQAQILLGRVALGQSDFPAAILRFDAALQKAPRSADALALRGVAKQRLQDVAGARADFDAAIAIDGDEVEARAGRCWIALRADLGLAQALEDAEAAVRVDPRHVPAQMCRGILQLKAGRWAEARAAFDAALQVEPGNPDAIYGRGFARKRSGDREGDADLDRAFAFDERVVARFRALDVRP